MPDNIKLRCPTCEQREITIRVLINTLKKIRSYAKLAESRVDTSNATTRIIYDLTREIFLEED